jgi:hypothetical protein
MAKCIIFVYDVRTGNLNGILHNTIYPEEVVESIINEAWKEDQKNGWDYNYRFIYVEEYEPPQQEEKLEEKKEE